MAQRNDTLETIRLALELLRRIPRGRKVTAAELQRELHGMGMERDLRSIQRQLEMLSRHFEIERDERSKPYGYRWLEHAPGLAVPHLTAQESLLLRLAEEHLRHLLPPRLMASMQGFFTQAQRNLEGSGASARLEREWPHKVRVVATSQPLLAPQVRAGVLEQVSEALYGNRWLELDYENAAGRRHQARVMPLGLAQQGPCLYLVCRFDGYDNERSLALHRMHRAEASTLTFERPAAFDLQRYDADGRFGFGEGERVVLRFEVERHAGRHLLETPLSADQQVREDGDWLAVQATVVDSAMLERWLRGFGALVRQVSRRPLVDAGTEAL